MIVIIVVIPAFEPDEKLVALVRRIRLETDFEIVVVNDGSMEDKDKIFKVISKLAVVLKHEHNMGKGQAIKTGLAYIHDLKKRDTGVVLVDADGQHKVEDMIKVAKALTGNERELIIGSRLFTGKVPFRSLFGNILTKFVFFRASGVKVQDTQTGLRAFSTGLIPFLLKIDGQRYEYEMNMLLKCAEEGIKIMEVPIDTIYLNDNQSSHFRTIKDSARIYKEIIKFSLSSLLSFCLDFVIFSILLLLTKDMEVDKSLLISNVTARLVSASFNFYVNRNYVFKHKEQVWKAAVKYFALAAVIMTVNTYFLTLMYKYIIHNRFISKIVVEVLLYIVSLCIQKLFIFNVKEGKQ